MQRRYSKIHMSSGPKYIIEERPTIFSKWKVKTFSFLDGRTDAAFLTIGELNKVMNYDDRKKYENRVINADLTEYINECERQRYLNPYHITKYRSENSRIIDTLCMAPDIMDLSDGAHTFRELYALLQEYWRECHASMANSGAWDTYKTRFPHGEGRYDGIFQVVSKTPYGIVSEFYDSEYWDEFHCEEAERADGDYDTLNYTERLEIIKKFNTEAKPKQEK